MLIVLEGLDGSGKQTHTDKICKRLEGEGYKYNKLHFPDYDSDSSALVKMYLAGAFGGNPNDVNPYVASSFYAVDRIASYLSNRKWQLPDGHIVIADRYTTSNAVHQAGKLQGVERDKYLEWLFDFEYNLLGLPSPDLVLFLNMPPRYSASFISNRSNKSNGCNQKDIHENDAVYLECAYNNALYVAEKCGWCIIDCVHNGNVRKIDDINNDIYDKIKEKCNVELFTD
ncbi:MAG: thymidylate kinase [Clostridiaceae bacterium]|nr:thymidylate kinase [Clostridiaceae bacterium]